MEKTIYLDHAATTAVSPEVFYAMQPYFTNYYANPSGIYGIARKNREEIEKSREVIGRALGTEGKNIYFTAGGSESDNWAILATAQAMCKKGRHIITTKIEHHAVLSTLKYLETQGFCVTYLNVDAHGMVSVDALRRAVREDTILISVMFANNEIGTIQPIAEIGALARERGIIFHTDAVQAFGHEKIDVNEMNIDLLSASGHKFHAPKGIGFLYIREGVKLGSLIHGGSQERGKRAGTENVPGIIGMGLATELAVKSLGTRSEKERWLRDYLAERILREIPYTRLNGHPKKRLANNVNISFQFVDGEALLVLLDMSGICVSAGSACSAGSKEVSHVLSAIGLPEELARGTIRFTLGEENTKEELDFVVECLKENIKKLRTTSPQYEDYMRLMAGFVK